MHAVQCILVPGSVDAEDLGSAVRLRGEGRGVHLTYGPLRRQRPVREVRAQDLGGTERRQREGRVLRKRGVSTLREGGKHQDRATHPWAVLNKQARGIITLPFERETSAPEGRRGVELRADHAIN